MPLHREPAGDPGKAVPTPGPWNTDGSVIFTHAASGAVACTRMPYMTCFSCGEGEVLRPLMPTGGTLAPITDVDVAAANARLIAAAPELLAVAQALERRLVQIGAHGDWLGPLRAAIAKAGQ